MANTKNEKINNNLRPLYVKEIIFEHTDEEHFLTVYDIEKNLKTITELLHLAKQYTSI